MRRAVHVFMWIGTFAMLRIVAGYHASNRAGLPYDEVINNWPQIMEGHE